MENEVVVMLLAAGTLLLAGRLLRALPKPGLASGSEVDASPVVSAVRAGSAATDSALGRSNSRMPRASGRPTPGLR